MPGFAASNSAIVCFQIGSYWLSVRLAVCHCSTTGCAAAERATASTDAATQAVNAFVCFIVSSDFRLVSAVKRSGSLGTRLGLEWHILQRVEIGLDAESWAFRQEELAVLEADRHCRGHVAKRSLRLHLLEHQEIRNGRGEMHRGGGADRSARIVRRDRDVIHVRHRGDLPDLGKATGVHQVGLDDAATATFDKL